MAYLGRPSAGDSPFAIGERALRDTSSPQPPHQRNPTPRGQQEAMATPSPYGSVSDEARRRYEERYAKKREEDEAKRQQDAEDARRAANPAAQQQQQRPPQQYQQHQQRPPAGAPGYAAPQQSYGGSPHQQHQQHPGYQQQQGPPQGGQQQAYGRPPPPRQASYDRPPQQQYQQQQQPPQYQGGPQQQRQPYAQQQQQQPHQSPPPNQYQQQPAQQAQQAQQYQQGGAPTQGNPPQQQQQQRFSGASQYSQQQSAYQQPQQQQAPPQQAQAPAQAQAQAPPPRVEDSELQALFQQFDSSRTGQLSSWDLQRLLEKDATMEAREDCVKMLMNIFDTDRSGSINFMEFEGLYRYIQDWHGIFRRFDQDNSGLIDRRELHAALQGFGFNLPADMVIKLEKRFAPPPKAGENPHKGISFDRFLMACVTVKHYTEAFRRFDTANAGAATLDYNAFMDIVMDAPS